MIVKHWHNQSLRVIVYLDDGIVAVQSKEAAEAASMEGQSKLCKELICTYKRMTILVSGTGNLT